MGSLAKRLKAAIKKNVPKPRLRRLTDGGLVSHMSDGSSHISEMRIHNYLSTDTRLSLTKKKNPEVYHARYKVEFDKMKQSLMSKHPNAKVGL